MLRDILNKLSGTHITVLALGAMFVPGALYAIPSFTNVAIEDPNTGSRAFVDPQRRLYTIDNLAAYANNPANLVDIEFFARSSSTGCSAAGYPIPAGKALIIRAVSGLMNSEDSGGTTNNTGFYLEPNVNCDGPELTGSTTTEASAPINISLGSGVALPSGTILSVYTFNSMIFGFIHGYLVPASAVPAAGTAEAAQLHGAALPPGYKAMMVRARR